MRLENQGRHQNDAMASFRILHAVATMRQNTDWNSGTSGTPEAAGILTFINSGARAMVASSSRRCHRRLRVFPGENPVY
jgi:hypothetical protein